MPPGDRKEEAAAGERERRSLKTLAKRRESKRGERKKCVYFIYTIVPYHVFLLVTVLWNPDRPGFA